MGNLGDKADATGKVIADEQETIEASMVATLRSMGIPATSVRILGFHNTADDDGPIMVGGSGANEWGPSPLSGAAGTFARMDDLLADVNRILRSAGCTPMPEGELLSGPMPTSTPAAGFPPTRPEPDPPCPHKAVVPGTGAEICPGCGGRVAEPPPTVGRLKRVWLTNEEHAYYSDPPGGFSEDEGRCIERRLGLPADSEWFGSHQDFDRQCWVAIVESKEWPEVLLGDEVPFHARHGR